MPYLNRSGIRIYYEDHGQGLPILLTHGYGASTGMWRGQVEAFRDRCRLIPWDMRGHGRSDSPDNQALYTQDLAVEDMLAILDALRIEKAVLAGHSLGGFLSLRFHAKHPERVQALILQGCGPGYRKPEARAEWNKTAEQRARKLEERGLKGLGGGSEVRVSEPGSAAGLARAARGILTQTDSIVIDSLPKVTVPTLVVAGERDAPYLTGTEYMASRIPEAVKHIIRDAGHGPNVDQPQVFNAIVSDFLKRVG